MSANGKKGSFKFLAAICGKRCNETQANRCYLNYGQSHCVPYLKETINPSVENQKVKRSKSKKKRKTSKPKRKPRKRR